MYNSQISGLGLIMEVMEENMLDNQNSEKINNADESKKIENANKANETKDDSRTISMQGVSGKVITGTVKVKKAVRRDDKKSAKTADSSKAVRTGENASKQTERADRDSTSITSSSREAASTSSVARKLSGPRKIGSIKDLKRETTKREETNVDAKREAVRTVENKRESVKTETDKTDRRVSSSREPIMPRKISSAKAEEKTQASSNIVQSSSSTRSTSAPQPRKLKSGSGELPQQVRSTRNSSQTDKPTISSRTDQSSNEEDSSKRRFKGPRKIASAENIKTGGPRKISSAVSDSLAATAQAFAHKKAQKENRQKQDFDRKNNRRKGERNNSFEPSPFDKDKDEDDEPKFHSQPRRRKKAADIEVEIPLAKSQEAKNKFGKNKTRSRSFSHETTKQDKRMERELEFTRQYRQQRKKKSEPKMTDSSPVTHVALLDTMTVKEFAEAISRTSADVIMHLMQNGVMATLNDNIDYETAAIIAAEFDVTTERLEDNTKIETDLFDEGEDIEENLVNRPPVVVVMGHVDHGKTTLLDYIRSSKVAGGEAGGITQKIGAYMVEKNGRKITFLDTPGHEAFTTMRARGAQATDIAILVVAADDGIMPQTVEAINHAKAADTEIIVAINKMDKPDANPNRVLEQLTKYDLVPEEWGGSTVAVPISALTGEGVEELLEMVLLSADLMELKVDPERQSKGIIIEARLDKNRGVVATALVQRGTLRQSDTILVDTVVGNVRAMKDSSGEEITEAGPSVPVEILGLSEVPEVGASFYVVEDERKAREYAERKASDEREEGFRKAQVITLDNLFSHIEEGLVLDFNVIIKADIVGSVEAMKQELEKLSNDEIRVNVIHGAAGAINESDVRLAEASSAVIIGFNVRPSNTVSDLAKDLGVEIRLYSVIYNAVEEVEAAMKGRLAPVYKEIILGHVEIRETYKVSSIGTIGGAYVTDGKITRNSKCRLIRNGIVVYEGEINSLRRFQDDVREVSAGYECGLTISNYNDLKVDDLVETYTMEEVER